MDDKTPGTPAAKDKSKNTAGMIVLVVLLAAVALSIAGWSAWSTFRNREIHIEGLPAGPDVPLNPDDPTKTKGGGPG